MESIKTGWRVVKNVIKLIIFGFIAIFYITILMLVIFLGYIIDIEHINRVIIRECRKLGYDVIFFIVGEWIVNPIYIRYDSEIPDLKRLVSISNHCSDYDWIFLLKLFQELKLDESVILLKRGIEKIPFIGYLIQKFGHIYLNRVRVRDIQIIEKNVTILMNKEKFNIALYPEGTYIFPESLEKAQNFAKNANIILDEELFIPKLVLLPRKTGFKTIIGKLADNYDGVIDITILMNPYVFMPSEEYSFWDIFITQNKVINQCLLVDFVPKSKIDKDFLERSFKNKEIKIRKYIEFSRAKQLASKEDFILFLENVDTNFTRKKIIKTFKITSQFKTFFLLAFPTIFYFICLFYIFITK